MKLNFAAAHYLAGYTTDPAVEAAENVNVPDPPLAPDISQQVLAGVASSFYPWKGIARTLPGGASITPPIATQPGSTVRPGSTIRPGTSIRPRPGYGFGYLARRGQQFVGTPLAAAPLAQHAPAQKVAAGATLEVIAREDHTIEVHFAGEGTHLLLAGTNGALRLKEATTSNCIVIRDFKSGCAYDLAGFTFGPDGQPQLAGTAQVVTAMDAPQNVKDYSDAHGGRKLTWDAIESGCCEGVEYEVMMKSACDGEWKVVGSTHDSSWVYPCAPEGVRTEYAVRARSPTGVVSCHTMSVPTSSAKVGLPGSAAAAKTATADAVPAKPVAMIDSKECVFALQELAKLRSIIHSKKSGHVKEVTSDFLAFKKDAERCKHELTRRIIDRFTALIAHSPEDVVHDVWIEKYDDELLSNFIDELPKGL